LVKVEDVELPENTNINIAQGNLMYIIELSSLTESNTYLGLPERSASISQQKYTTERGMMSGVKSQLSKCSPSWVRGIVFGGVVKTRVTNV